MKISGEAKFCSGIFAKRTNTKTLNIFSSLLIFSFGVVFLTLLPIAGHAQLSTGDILGNISDASGAALPGAKIVLTNNQTHEVHTVTSDSSGEYIFTLLQPGNYSIQINATGFKPYSINDVSLSGGDRRRVVIKMLISGISQSVEGSAASPAL